MSVLDKQARSVTIERLKDQLGALTHALDLQAAALLRKKNVSIVDAYLDGRGHVVLIGQYSTGETREFTREDYLPDGDDGGSGAYQAKVLEQLSLEQTALREALESMVETQRLLDSPPVPLS